MNADSRGDPAGGLIAFVQARLDEDEAAAKAAAPGPWAWEATGDKDSSWALGFVQDEDGNDLSGEIEPGTGIVIDGVCESINGRVPDAAHIARHDPARTLREVAAKRAILAEHYILTCDDRNPDYEEFSVVPWGTKGDQSSGCVTCHYYGMGGVKGYGTCRTMRALAVTWSDHADYRQEWAGP